MVVKVERKELKAVRFKFSVIYNGL